MAKHGSFEGNAQTLRILTRLENRYVRNSPESDDGVFSEPLGLNLLYRTIASVIKYDREIPSEINLELLDQGKLAKGYYKDDSAVVAQARLAVLGQACESGALRTIECQIMDLADDIAYSTYDLEDCMIAGLTHPLDLISISDEVSAQVAERTTEKLKGMGYEYNLQSYEINLVYEKLFRSIIRMNIDSDYRIESEFDKAAYLGWNYQNSLDVARNPLKRRRMTEYLIQSAIDSISIPHWNDKCPALTKLHIGPQHLLYIEALKHYNYIHTIKSRDMELYAEQADMVLTTLFEFLKKKPLEQVLPEEWLPFARYATASKDDNQRMRVICDYLSSMTDSEAVNMYQRIRNPNV